MASVAASTTGCTLGVIAGLIALVVGGGDSGGSGNVAPEVAIGTISRTTGEVAIPITVFDSNGDTVTLVVEYDDGGGLQTADDSPLVVDGSKGGTDYVLTWDAPSDFSGDTSYRSGITISITPTDGKASGEQSDSAAFDYGNDDPQITEVTVDADGLNRISGNTVVRFTVSDSSTDSIDVTKFEYAFDGDFDANGVTVALTTGALGNFPSGSLTNLSSSVAGTEHSFTWNSYLTEQGTVSGAKIRITLGDDYDGDSGALESDPFDVANSVLVTIGTINRTVGQVSVPVTVFSSTDAMVTLTVEYDLDDGFGLQAASTLPAQLQGSAAGTPGVLTWDAPTDIGTGFEGDVTLHITPDDGISTGPTEVSSVFAFGNDPPVLEVGMLSVDTDEDDAASGNVVVRFTITDSGSDSCEVESFQYSLAGDFSDAIDVDLTTGKNGNFPSGALTNLATSAAGIEHAITWNSRLSITVDQFDMAVRVMVRDSFTASSAYEPSAAFDLLNSTTQPPIAQLSGVQRADIGGLRTGAVWIDYALIDAEQDPCDVTIEYSTDGKFSWNPCTGYPSPDSEGLYDLPAGATSGIVHRFVWDAGADLTQEESVHLRITPAAVDGVGVAAETSLVLGAGANPGVALFADGETATTAAGSNHSVAADFNRDGNLDLAVVNSSAASVSILLGRGNGTFASAANIPVTSDPRQVAVADFNNDGILDLAITRFAAPGVQVRLGVGDGTFGAATNLSLGGAFDTVGIATGDFNNDGNPDIVCGASNTVLIFTTGRIICFRGQGNGLFNSAQETTIDHAPMGIAVGDFNGDGNLDAAVAARDDDLVNICLGNGGGTFPTVNTSNVTSQPEEIVAGYFNNDRHVDLAVTNTASGTQLVSILRGNGNGTFQAQLTRSTGQAEPRAIVTGDFDGDGDMDLATVHTTDQVVVLKGNNDATFATTVSFTGGTGAEHSTTGDFNNDGVPDLAVARSGGTVATLIGRRETGTWSVLNVDFNPGDGSGNTVGATTAPGGNDWFGSPRINRVGVRLFAAQSDDRPDDLRKGSTAMANDFLHLLRLAKITPTPPSMEPLTRAWTLSGDIRLMRRADPGVTDTGYRIEPIARFGDRTAPADPLDLRRAGLDLTDGTFANQRGIIVDLPYATARTTGEIDTALAANKIHVYVRQTDWLRAGDFSSDPLDGQADDMRYLPRIDIGGGQYRDLLVERHAWVKALPATGNVFDVDEAGPRFVVDHTNTRIRVLLSRGGTAQAYFEP